MIRFSRFAHTFELGEAVTLYHSLRMKPVYLSRDSFEDLQAWLAGPFCIDFDSAPDAIKEEVLQLKNGKFLLREKMKTKKY